VLINSTDLTKIKLGVNPDAHEQHGPNKIKLGVNSGAHEQHGPNQKTTGGEPRCS
jgi:hypothetical protein